MVILQYLWKWKAELLTLLPRCHPRPWPLRMRSIKERQGTWSNHLNHQVNQTTKESKDIHNHFHNHQITLHLRLHSHFHELHDSLASPEICFAAATGRDPSSCARQLPVPHRISPAWKRRGPLTTQTYFDSLRCCLKVQLIQVGSDSWPDSEGHAKTVWKSVWQHGLTRMCCKNVGLGHWTDQTNTSGWKPAVFHLQSPQFIPHTPGWAWGLLLTEEPGGAIVSGHVALHDLDSPSMVQKMQQPNTHLHSQ